MLILNHIYKSTMRGKAKANLGWYYDYSIYGKHLWEPEVATLGTFQCLRHWFGGPIYLYGFHDAEAKKEADENKLKAVHQSKCNVEKIEFLYKYNYKFY